MSTRPEILFPLFAELESLDGIGPKMAQLMAHIDVETPRDLLFSLPYSVVDRRRRDTIKGVDLPTTLTVEVTVGAHRPARNRSGAYRVHVEDSQNDFQLVFSTPAAAIWKRNCPPVHVVWCRDVWNCLMVWRRWFTPTI